jgi:hypothetical protein
VYIGNDCFTSVCVDKDDDDDVFVFVLHYKASRSLIVDTHHPLARTHAQSFSFFPEKNGDVFPSSRQRPAARHIALLAAKTEGEWEVPNTYGGHAYERSNVFVQRNANNL